MKESFLLILGDIHEVITGLTIKEMMRIFLISMWVLILGFPLGSQDTRDYIVAAMYVLFAIFAGVILVFALPQNLMPAQSIESILGAIILMGVTALLRWIYAEKRRQKYLQKILQTSLAGRDTNGSLQK